MGRVQLSTQLHDLILLLFLTLSTANWRGAEEEEEEVEEEEEEVEVKSIILYWVICGCGGDYVCMEPLPHSFKQ